MRNCGGGRLRGLPGRALSLILALILLTAAPGGARGAGATKKETSRAIAIVFDNSGSMYTGGNRAWCQATYAIEVFAAMMNTGDVLQVYPMNDITVNGRAYTKEDPLVIRGAGEASVIREISTPRAAGTPIESLETAYQGLTGTSADEKWLIVLTDGATFYEDDRELSASQTQARLSETLDQYNQSVNVLYLGIGRMSTPQVSGSGTYTYYGTTATSDQVPSALSGMCNLIFGRDELPGANKTNDSLSFDVPISKLITFVQGQDVGNVTLTDASGSQLRASGAAYSTHYSELGAGNYNSTPDTSLQGMIVTFEDCAPGTYRLNYSGQASSVSAYYEPDVDLAVRLVDENGQRVRAGADIYPGTYRMEYGIADATGKLIESPLLGNTDYTVTYELNGESKTVKADQAGSVEVELAAGDTLETAASVTFLSGYRINRTGRELGWPEGGFSCQTRPLGLLELKVSGGADSYPLAQLEEQGVYELKLMLNGEALTGEELDSTGVDVSLTGGNARYELERTDAGYALTLGYAGSALDTQCGDYTLTLTARHTDVDGQTGYAEPVELSFSVEEQISQLELELDQPQSYYVISQVGDGEPMTLTLTINGLPLTEAQMAQASVRAQAEGVPLLVERVAGRSAYTIRVDPNGKLEAGKYKVTVTAEARDEIGQSLSAQKTKKIELRPYPKWLPVVIALAVILLLAALIWLFLNMKVLPKKIKAGKTTFRVGGMDVGGGANCAYPTGGKKRGTLDITSPKYAGGPSVKASIHLDLEAVSPRRTKSAARAARVRGLSASGAVRSVKIGSASFGRDQNTGKLVKLGGKAGAPVDFEIRTGAKCSAMAEVMDDDGGTTTVSLNVTLKFS